MKIYPTKDFKKAYKKRIEPNKKLEKRFEERYDLFAENPNNPQLHNHSLGGKLRGYKAFSVTGDIRAIYYILGDTAYLVDIGTHNQVYGK